MRRILLAAVTALAVAAPMSFGADAALACTKAKIGGTTKCLQRGQFCSAATKAQYPRYGFRCVGGRLR